MALEIVLNRIAVALALLLAVWAAPERAAAHAVLIDTIPAHRAVLAVPPEHIVLRFNESVTPLELRVLDSQGRVVPLASPPHSIDREVHAPLRPGLGAGTYVVSYRVVSADGHPIGGSLLFAVGAAPERWSEESSAASTQDVATVKIAAIANRAAYLVALFMAAGGLLFATAMRRGDGIAPPLRRASLLAAITALLGIGLHGVVVSGGAYPLTSAFWATAFGTPQARSVLAALLGLAVAFVLAPRLTGAIRRWTAIAGAAFALMATGITGHSAAAGILWWPAAALHLVCAGFWFGALPPLIAALRAPPSAETALLLNRFSNVAVAAVAVLVIAGLALALQRVASSEDFATTDYGRLVLAKMAGAALLVGIAGWNKFNLTPLVTAGDTGAATRLRRVVAAELILMTGVVALAALLAHTDPHAGHPHDHRDHAAHRQQAASALTLALRSGDRIATVELHPAKSGRNTLTVRFATPAGTAIAPLEASAELSLPAAGIEAFIVKLSPLAPGHFAAEITEIALPGRWQIRIDALITDFEKAIFRGEAEIQ